MNIDRNLLSFYFGSVSDEQRLTIEREMLTDQEVLLDYLDLKREVEGAAGVPIAPSPLVWQRLQAKMVVSKRAKISLLVGASVAAAITALLILLQPKVETAPALNGKAILFDSGSEQFGHSNVL